MYPAHWRGPSLYTGPAQTIVENAQIRMVQTDTGMYTNTHAGAHWDTEWSEGEEWREAGSYMEKGEGREEEEGSEGREEDESPSPTDFPEMAKGCVVGRMGLKKRHTSFCAIGEGQLAHMYQESKWTQFVMLRESCA